mgnify:CR=1 FL=1
MIKLPVGVEINSLIDDLRIFSWEASEILLYYSQILKDSNNKSNIIKNDNLEDPVTIADLNVNKTIIQRINEKYKHICWEILSEENVKIASNTFDIKANWLWVLDPLDGTKDFLQGTGQYAVHLGLVHNNQPVLGVVLLPELEELWLGVVGVGAWCEDIKGNRSSVMFSQRRKLRDLIIVSSRNHRDLRLEKLIGKLDLGGTKSIGSVGWSS